MCLRCKASLILGVWKNINWVKSHIRKRYPHVWPEIFLIPWVSLLRKSKSRRKKTSRCRLYEEGARAAWAEMSRDPLKPADSSYTLRWNAFAFCVSGVRVSAAQEEIHTVMAIFTTSLILLCFLGSSVAVEGEGRITLVSVESFVKVNIWWLLCLVSILIRLISLW